MIPARITATIAALALLAGSCIWPPPSPPDPPPVTTTTTVAPTTTTTAPPTTTVAPTSTTTTAPPTTTVPPTTTTLPEPGGDVWTEDFTSPASMDRLEFVVWHRDFQGEGTWEADHAPINGTDPDACGSPDTTRTLRHFPDEFPTERDSLTPDPEQYIYRCAPGDDPTLAHLMTSIGDVSGYSFGAFWPNQTFTDVSHVSWDVGLLSEALHGERQWVDVAIIPAALWDPLRPPCAIDWVPCSTAAAFPDGSFDWPVVTLDELGAVGTTWETNRIPAVYNGLGDSADSREWESGEVVGDPAFTDIRIRRTHTLTDNANGTITFSIEDYRTGEQREVATIPGEFPSGPVVVVFKDHGYTPDKSCPGEVCASYTWHWDDIEIRHGG